MNLDGIRPDIRVPATPETASGAPAQTTPAAGTTVTVPGLARNPAISAARAASPRATASATSGIASIMLGQQPMATAAIGATPLAESAKAKLRQRVLDAIASGRAPELIIVSGAPGTGKTTALAALTKVLARHGLINNIDVSTDVPFLPNYVGRRCRMLSPGKRARAAPRPRPAGWTKAPRARPDEANATTLRECTRHLPPRP